MVSGMRRLSRRSATAEADALARLRGDQPVGDRGDRRLRIVGVRLDVDRLDRDARLPARERRADPILDRVARGDGVGLEQEPASVPPNCGSRMRSRCSVIRIDADRLADVGLALRPRDAAVGADARRKAMPRPKMRPASIASRAVVLAFELRQREADDEHGSQRKMMSSRLTMMISRISAQIVMIGIDSEQIMPMLTPLGLARAAVRRLSRSLCNGHGSTESTRSLRPSPLARLIWPHSMSDIMKAVFLSNLRRPAGDVSSGSAMRIGRAGASGSKKPAS